MLPGITYDGVLALAASIGMPFDVRRISREEVFSASELLLTSSTKEVTPITHIDGKPVGSGRPGPFFARLHAAYQEFKSSVMRA
jgi:D-alanine transaminase